MPVVAVDTVASPQDHVVVVTAWEKDWFWVHDPSVFFWAKGSHRRKRSRLELQEAAGNEFFAPEGR